MATPNQTLGTRRVFANLKYLYVTPWTDESTLGTNTYDIVDVVADTTSIEQADNDVNAIDHEVSSSPLYENVNLGEKTFACESIDLQNDVLKQLFGWTIDQQGNVAYAPTGYKDLYVAMEIGFNSTEDIIVLPKVKMNSRAVIASMRTDVSRANITGSCYPAYVNNVQTDMAFVKGGTSYTITAKPASV